MRNLFKRATQRAFSTAVRNEDLFGQPTRLTHPYLIASGEITPGHRIEDYRNRRLELAKSMTSRSIAVVPSYEVKYGSQSIFYPFQQNNNLLYLSGFDEPNSCLVIERVDDSVQSFLFVKENDPHALLWEGPRAGVQRAQNYFGVDKTFPIEALNDYVSERIRSKAGIFHDIDSNSILPGTLSSNVLQNGSSITQSLHAMRVIKQLSERNMMKKACKSSAEAFLETMKWSCKNKIASENSVAAKMEFECRLRGASGLAYVPVVASGARSLILHYTRDNMLADIEKDLMFMDAGGKFDGYCTDISRAWPLSGKFSKPQRQIYEAVLRVQKACIKLCSLHAQEQIDLNMLNEFSCYMMVEELRGLGFKDLEKSLDKLYPHSIGHYLGLDLHDCPKISGDAKLRPGMVLTIEPGLYIPYDIAYPPEYHGIGVRVEDDVVIEDHGGCTVMTEEVPKEVEHIEEALRA